MGMTTQLKISFPYVPFPKRTTSKVVFLICHATKNHLTPFQGPPVHKCIHFAHRIPLKLSRQFGTAALSAHSYATDATDKKQKPLL